MTLCLINPRTYKVIALVHEKGVITATLKLSEEETWNYMYLRNELNVSPSYTSITLDGAIYAL